MITLAPNVYVAKYLLATAKLPPGPAQNQHLKGSLTKLLIWGFP